MYNIKYKKKNHKPTRMELQGGPKKKVRSAEPKALQSRHAKQPEDARSGYAYLSWSTQRNPDDPRYSNTGVWLGDPK
jgi:hypothetical protein